MSETIYSEFCSGKCIMQQKEWAVKKCKDCGGELKLIINNEYKEVKQCEDCGRKTMLLKHIRENLKGDVIKECIILNDKKVK